jgi:hypothetical protein
MKTLFGWVAQKGRFALPLLCLLCFTGLERLAAQPSADATLGAIRFGTPTIQVNGKIVIGGGLTFAATNTVQVELQTSFINGIMTYTLDGSDPAESPTAIEYVGPFWITNSVTLRAIAFSEDFSRWA